MKKRMLLLSLAMALLVVFMLPAAALAKGDNHSSKSRGVNDFTGGGIIAIANEPGLVIEGNIWRFSNELVVSVLPLQADWDLLNGAAFWSTHDSIVHVAANGDARGFMRGTFIIQGADGTLEGSFEGKIRGNLGTWQISDSGTWRSTGGTGSFEGVRAWGKWSANLDPVTVPGTVGGPMVWQGKYLSR